LGDLYDVTKIQDFLFPVKAITPTVEKHLAKSLHINVLANDKKGAGPIPDRLLCLCLFPDGLSPAELTATTPAA
jgi:hypothetical protein